MIVDNHDSFTYNLVQIIREYGGCSFDVVKGDQVDILGAGIYDGFLFSPGPGVPSGIPAMTSLLRLYHKTKSFLGICLGHQAIAEAFGMELIQMEVVRHGIDTLVRITDPSDYLFTGMPREFKAGLYHSWAVGNKSLKNQPGSDMRITAMSDDGIIMAISHTRWDIKGVQFHP